MEKIGGFTFEPICDALTEELKKNSEPSRYSNPEVVIHPSGCVMPLKFKNYFERIYNFEVFPDDVWIITYPKSGTTWTQEMVWLLINKLDFNTAKSVNLWERCPFLELESIIQTTKEEEEFLPKTIEMCIKAKRPRCLKSHLPVELLPKGIWEVKPKIIHVSRDPRDVAISYYHHYRLWNGYRGTLENFTKVFLADKHVYSPFWSHLLGFWNLKDKSHIHFNNFESMKKDLSNVIKKTAQFLQVNLSDKDVEELKNHLSFNNMKNNDFVNFLDLAKESKKLTKTNDEELVFLRKGESGEGLKTYDEETLEKFKDWTAQKLRETSFSEYPYSAK